MPDETVADDRESIQSSHYYAATSLRDCVPRQQIVNKLVAGGLDPGAAERVVAGLERGAADAHKRDARRNVLYGALWCGGGVLLTAATFALAAGGGKFLVAWGAVLYGVVRFVRGAIQSAAARG